jgi:hypothetical protein
MFICLLSWWSSQFFFSENDFLFLKKGAVLRNGGQQAIFFELLSLF